MEKFFLEEASINRKEDALDFIKEFIEYDSDLNGMGPFDKVCEEYSYEEALEKNIKMKDKDYAYSIDRCPGKTFFLIRENDNKMIGCINVRWDLLPRMLEYGGHIGYSIRPTERRKGYNKINLYLGLLEAKKIGLDKVMLDCDSDNIASDKTLKALGGVFTKCVIDPYDGLPTNVYWFDVDKSLKEYKNIYSPYISKKVK